MYDKDIVKDILIQIDVALDKILIRSAKISDAAYLSDSEEGMEKLDGICMLFIGVAESLKDIDKITNGELLPRYPKIDWIGVKGFWDIVVYRHFDIDAELVYWICTHELRPLSDTIKAMLREFEPSLDSIIVPL